MLQLRNNGALHQCINELSTNLRRCVSEIPPEFKTEHPIQEHTTHERNSFGNNSHLSRSRSNSLSENRSKSPSHFITVIELKEEDASTRCENKTSSTMTSSSSLSPSTTAAVNVTSVKSGGNKVADMKRNIENNNDGVTEDVPKASDLLASIHEAKKKIPPRPPPKIATRRVEPPVVPATATKRYEETPDSSLERNIKPSDIFRQKSNESLESRSSGSGSGKGNIESTAKVKPSEIREEFERRLHKSESLEKTKNKSTDSPTGSLGKMSTENVSNKSYRVGGSGSLDKAAFKGSDSLKTTDSRESLISNGANSDKIKSYESASSVESLRNIEESYLDREPYYDTVPVEDETLPMPSRTYKTSTSQVDPESPGHHSNYVNINYFLE